MAPTTPSRQEILDLVDVYLLATSYSSTATEKLRELGHEIRNMGDLYRLHRETFARLEQLCPEILEADYRLNTRQLAILANTHGPVDMKALEKEREAVVRRALRGAA